MDSQHIRFVRKPAVLNRFGLSNSRLYMLIKRGEFPAPIKIGPNSSAWIESELDAAAQKIVAKARAAA